MLSVVTDDAAHSELAMSLDELAREGARRMLAAALEAEVDAYIAAHAALTDEPGPRLGGPRDGGAQAVPERDPAPLGAAQPEGGRGAAAVVSARAQLSRLRAGIGGAVWVGGRPIGLGHHPAVPAVAGRTRGLSTA